MLWADTACNNHGLEVTCIRTYHCLFSMWNWNTSLLPPPGGGMYIYIYMNYKQYTLCIYQRQRAMKWSIKSIQCKHFQISQHNASWLKISKKLCISISENARTPHTACNILSSRVIQIILINTVTKTEKLRCEVLKQWLWRLCSQILCSVIWQLRTTWRRNLLPPYL
jgi:hypothetical protein